MKNIVRTLPAKITSFILCIVALGIAAASVVGAVLLVDLEFYVNSKELLLEDYLYDEFIGDAYNIVWKSFNEDRYYDIEYLEISADNTNLRFVLADMNGNAVFDNIEDKNISVGSDKWKYIYYFKVVESGETLNIEGLGKEMPQYNENVYGIYAYLEEGLPIADEYALINALIDIGYSLRYAIYIIGIVSMLVSIICFIHLMCVSARRAGTEELHPGALNRVPFDVLIIGIFVIFAFSIVAVTDIFYSGELLQNVLLVLLAVAATNVALGMCMSVAARIKQKSLLKNTLVWKTLSFSGRIIKKIVLAICLNIPLIWKHLIVALAIVVCDLMIYLIAIESVGLSILLWVIEKLALIVGVVYFAISLRKLQRGGEALASGELSYDVNTQMMFGDLRRHGENLNSIANGMSKAVEERLQSERMKTELITNVSHDIKNPLTSIINYAGLIAEEECDCETHKEYAEVLVRKSTHLKRLLDDLVEISKAATGNLDVVLLPCEAGVLLTQVAGEFEVRCQRAGLTLITSQPDESMKIELDSRRIWRVFENLMGNACKYSLEGSRVYLSLEKINNKAVFIFKNTSREALNISANELMERFVRGDASRTTEGNGLGLSIARSLTELQNGKMDISIDGDLFKVTLKFDLAD